MTANAVDAVITRLDHLPSSTMIAAVRSNALRQKAESVALMRALAKESRAHPAVRDDAKRRHKQEIREARAVLDAARSALQALGPRHQTELDRLDLKQKSRAERFAAAKALVARCKEQLRKHRDPEPYRQASARRRADAVARRLLDHELKGTGVSPMDAAEALARTYAPDGVQRYANTLRAQGLHDAADALEQGRPADPESLAAYKADALATLGGRHSSSAAAYTQAVVEDLSLGARTAAAHLAGTVDATELLDKHTIPIDEQLWHKDHYRCPITPLNWRDYDHLYALLSYLPPAVRTAAAMRISRGVSGTKSNPLYVPNVPDFGHQRTFLHARDLWAATETAARKVAEPGDNPQRLALAARAADAIRTHAAEVRSY